jgi:hypothetical protein
METVVYVQSYIYNCNTGFDGGLPANFLMEMYDTESMELRWLLPYFTLTSTVQLHLNYFWEICKFIFHLLHSIFHRYSTQLS